MNSEEKVGQLVVARQQLSQQLKLLGYRKGDTVYLRAFYHSSDPRKAGDSGKKAEARNSGQLVGIIQTWQSEGRGVYLVVNSGGHCDKDVIQCRAIFYEHDDLDKELSRQLWQRLGLPEPTLQVDTGGKSIHSYWVFDEPIDPTLWKELQTDLLQYADADRALKNPSRVMRLAGAYHISPSGAFPTTIISASGNRYSFDLLRAVVPSQVTQVTAQIAQTTLPSKWPTTTDEDIPLSECLRVEERDLIANGVLEGRRNDTGAALARNLIGTSLRLQYLNERFSGDPRLLFDNYCARCSPPLDAHEADQIWKSALKDNPSATLTDDAIMNCVKSWKRRQSVLSGTTSQTTSLNNTSSPGIGAGGLMMNTTNLAQSRPVEVSLKERVLDIISRGLSSSNEKLALLELSKQVGIQVKEIESIATLLRQDLEVEEGREERKAEISQLLTVSDNSLNLSDFLPKQLSQPLKLWCKWLNIPESVALTAVLTTVSTLHQVGTELVIHHAMDFAVPPVLFSAVVGESGQKKSPVYRTLIKKPLRVLQNQATQVYEQQLAQYEYELNEWEKGSQEPCRSSHRAKPNKPTLPIYFFTDATGEGIKTQAQETPNKAMFALIDELAGLFNSANQYRGGKGSDRQDVLSYYDGLGQTVLRAGGIKVDVERIYLSIFGGIQPDVLKEHTKDLKDADGHWARFLFVNQPLAASTLPDDNTDINLKDLLSGYYGRIASLPLIQYRLSPKAFKRYQQVYNELELKRVGHPQAGMRAVYSKMEGAIGRLALNLHAIDIATNDSTFAFIKNEISLETMNKAIALAEFYTREIKTLHADSRADTGELSALLAKILQLSQDKGRLSATEANQRIRSVKNNTHAFECFKELEVMGYGKVTKEGKSWIFYPTSNQSSRIDKIDARIDAIVDGSEKIKPATSKAFELSLSQNRQIDRIDNVAPAPQAPLASLEGASQILEKDENLENVYSVYDEVENLAGQATERIDTSVDTPVYSGENVYSACNQSTDNLQVQSSEDIAEAGQTQAVQEQNSDETSEVAPSPHDRQDVYCYETDSDTSLNPLSFSFKAGDKIRCYPTQHHADNKWAVKATVIEVKTERGWFSGCTVQYQNKKKETKTVDIAGGCVDWILKKL